MRATVAGRVGQLTLDRPAALNALDLPMIDALYYHLERFAQDDAITGVVLDSASPRAFCAGGDIRAMRAGVVSGDLDRSLTFLAHEYRLNALLAAYPKPLVSLVDGIDLGGGLGLSVHSRFSAVTERAVLAMPETAIGFFPDIGSSYFLPRLPGRIGRYLALTGVRICAADAVRYGLATHYVPGDLLEKAREEIVRGEPIDSALDRYAVEPPPGELDGWREQIDQVFGADSVPGVLDALHAVEGEWAERTRAVLASVSVRSLLLTWELHDRGSRDDLAGCLRRELGLARYVLAGHDFAEGVRALLIDKDKAPRWDAAPFGPRDAAALVDAIDAARAVDTDTPQP